MIDPIPSNRSDRVMTVHLAGMKADLDGAAAVVGGFCKVPIFVQHAPHLSAVPRMANLEMTCH